MPRGPGPSPWRGARRLSGLLLEQVVEAATDVAGASGMRRGVALDGDAEGEEGALVPCALVRDPLGDGLRALEAPSGVEVRALAARVERGAAVRALLERRVRDRQDRTARRAPRHGAAREHPAAPRRIGRRPRRLRASRLGALRSIALLAILSVAHAPSLGPTSILGTRIS